MEKKPRNQRIINIDTPSTVNIYDTASSDPCAHWLRIPQTSDEA